MFRIQVKSQAARHVLAPLQVSQKAHNDEYTANYYHAHVQNSKRLLEQLWIPHLVFQRQHLYVIKAIFISVRGRVYRTVSKLVGMYKPYGI